MRNLLVAGLLAVSTSVVAVPAPAEARGWNCWWEDVYGPDIDVDGDNIADPGSGVWLGQVRVCEVEMDEKTPEG